MDDRTVCLLDLPDEILLIIMGKLGSRDVLCSLLGVNRRLDQMARSINITKFVDFSIMLPNGQYSSIDDVELNRYCDEVLPQIHHQVVVLNFTLCSMERILLDCEYPSFTTIVFITFSTDLLLCSLTGKESFFLVIIS